MRKSKGFTLLELIIVIIVIGILAAMAMPQFMRVTERGRIAKALGHLELIRKAQGMYHIEQSEYGSLTNIASASLGGLPEVGAINTNDSDWTYTVTGPSSTVFTAVATRDSCGYKACVINITQAGTIGGDHPGATGTW